jgi:hypothetical protein
MLGQRFALFAYYGFLPMITPTKEEIARFNSKWVKRGDCHIWIANKDSDGYGRFYFRYLQRMAHRVAMVFAGKTIPKHHVVNHTCRNRACVNPQHLESIPANENWKRDSTNPGYINSRKTHCKNGHPYDRTYNNRRYCSICEAEKTKRLRAKWKAEGRIPII